MARAAQEGPREGSQVKEVIQKATYLFIVDTDSYAGGFHRELAAYLTGRWDQATHGGVQAEIAMSELTPEQRAYFESHNIEVHRQVDDGCQDVTQVIWPTPGWFNYGNGEHVKGEPTPEQLEKCYQGRPWPAYQSVALFFDEMPLAPIVQVMRQRAKEFAKYWAAKPVLWAKEIKITGFRIVLEVTRMHETLVWEDK